MHKFIRMHKLLACCALLALLVAVCLSSQAEVIASNQLIGNNNNNNNAQPNPAATAEDGGANEQQHRHQERPLDELDVIDWLQKRISGAAGGGAGQRPESATSVSKRWAQAPSVNSGRLYEWQLTELISRALEEQLERAAERQLQQRQLLQQQAAHMKRHRTVPVEAYIDGVSASSGYPFPPEAGSLVRVDEDNDDMTAPINRGPISQPRMEQRRVSPSGGQLDGGLAEAKTSERRRRMSMTPSNLPRTFKSTEDQLSAMQSLGITLGEEAFSRAYKPRIMSTARGFGRR